MRFFRNIMSKCNCSVKLKNVYVKENNNIILNSISLEVNHGETLALLGKNGAGKTTLLKAILKRISYSGQISFFNFSGKFIKNPKIGYVPQKLNFEKSTPLTVREFFALSMSRMPIWLRVNSLLSTKISGILEKFSIKYLIDKPIGTLSGGELQRVLLAFALEPAPDILILDEPSSALDRKGISFFFSLIVRMREEFHMPAILVSHDLAQVSKNVTKYALIDSGKILEVGEIDNINKSKNIKSIFGV